MRPIGNLINVSFSYNRPYKNVVDIINFVRSEVDTEMRQVLTENIIKNAAPRRSKYYLSDGRGLLLEVNPNHSKYWIVRIYMGKKEIRRSIGAYPAISLKEARMKAYEIKSSKNLTIDCDTTFEQAYKMFYDFHYSNLTLMHQETIKARWKNYIEPKLGSLPLNRITPNMIVRLCQNILTEGHIETARRVRIIISQVFEFAVAQNIVDSNPTAHLSSIFPSTQRKHYACLTEPSDIAALMRNIEAYPHRIVRLALLFSARTFCRPGEIRMAEWKEVDLNAGTWTIKADKMKMNRDHVVPLSTQNISLLYELHSLTGSGQWLFTSARTQNQPLSEGTIRVALRTMGYSNEQMTPHGFRSMASTVLNTFGWPKDYIELQLSHVDHSIRGIYNRSLYLHQRWQMMQWWSDYLDAMRDNTAPPQKPIVNVFA